MRSGICIHVIRLAVGGLFAVKVLAIPAGGALPDGQGLWLALRGVLVVGLGGGLQRGGISWGRVARISRDRRIHGRDHDEQTRS